MDHIRISGTKTSSVILSKTKKLKRLKSEVRKVPKQAKVNRDVVINPKYFKNIIHRPEKYCTCKWDETTQRHRGTVQDLSEVTAMDMNGE